MVLARRRAALMWLAATPLLTLADRAAAAGRPAKKENPRMQLLSSYPVVVTDKLAACRDFYVSTFGFKVEFEAKWFVYLTSGAQALAFMTPDHPSQPPGPERFGGQGLLLTLQVADAQAEFRRLQQRGGVAFAHPLRDESWGQRRFALIDPSGMWVDVVQQIEPAPGYWERYMPAR